MLMSCTECQGEVSSKASFCPHCGFPMAGPPRKYKKAKRRRLPNGFGQITKITGRNLRRPYRAMITAGKTEDGKPIQKMLKPQAYFATYNEAYQALMKYHDDPFDLANSITVKELNERWKKRHYQNITQTGTMDRAFLYAEPIWNMRVVDVRTRHIRDVVYEGTRTVNGVERKIPVFVQFQLKNVLNLMFDYAVEYEMVSHNVARDFKWKKPDVATKHHISFTDEEMRKLWANNQDPFVKMILIQCYTGFRPGELVELLRGNVYLAKHYAIGGKKTRAGKDRAVPFHESIRKFVKEFYEEAQRVGRATLLGDPKCPDQALTPSKYAARFARVVRELGLNEDHRPHDPRKQFVTMAKKYGVDEYAIKRIVGHSISDLTESIYTDRDIKWLESEISKIKVYE